MRRNGRSEGGLDGGQHGLDIALWSTKGGGVELCIRREDGAKSAPVASVYRLAIARHEVLDFQAIRYLAQVHLAPLEADRRYFVTFAVSAGYRLTAALREDQP